MSNAGSDAQNYRDVEHNIIINLHTADVTHWV